MAGLLEVLVRATGATRVLEIGAGSGESGQEILSALPADGTLLTIERDAAAAARARAVFAAMGASRRATVLIGDAERYLHKIAGPFDVIHQDSDPRRYDAVHDRLLALLRAGGTLITRNTHDAGDYNRRLASDPRLATVSLGIGSGITIAVKEQDPT